MQPIERVRLARLRRQAGIFQGGEARKDIGLLIAAADAQARALLRREWREVLPRK